MPDIKVILADTQELSSAGITTFLAEKKDFKLVDIITNKKDFFETLKHHEPDVLIVDYNLADFVSITDLIKFKATPTKTKVLIISSDDNKQNINKALEAGISGYITKECSKQEIINAIYATAKGQKFFCNKVLDIMLEKHTKSGEEDCEPTNLSNRETEILKLIAKGNSTMKIADLLNLSHHTVNTHRKNILRKLNVKSPTELIIYAVNTGLINPK